MLFNTTLSKKIFLHGATLAQLMTPTVSNSRDVPLIFTNEIFSNCTAVFDGGHLLGHGQYRPNNWIGKYTPSKIISL